jgi:hypothetical protein
MHKRYLFVQSEINQEVKKKEEIFLKKYVLQKKKNVESDVTDQIGWSVVGLPSPDVGSIGGPGQQAAEHLHHHCQAVTLVPACIIATQVTII